MASHKRRWERSRARARATERETNRQKETDRQTDRQTERQREIEREREKRKRKRGKRMTTKGGISIRVADMPKRILSHSLLRLHEGSVEVDVTKIDRDLRPSS